MIRNILIILVLAVTAWVTFHYPKADWYGELVSEDPSESSVNLPQPWVYKDFTITPRVKYHIKAVILSKHHYWGPFVEDTLSSYDLALGWGAMSNAMVINKLYIYQTGRWYFYKWSKYPPIDVPQIISHSSNHHIIAANQDVLEDLQYFKRYDVVELDGYLVDVSSNKRDWSWHSSLSRFDSGAGSCKLVWVTNAALVK